MSLDPLSQAYYTPEAGPLKVSYQKYILPGRRNGLWPVPNIQKIFDGIGGSNTHLIKPPRLMRDWRADDYDYVMNSLPGSTTFDLICYSDGCQHGYPAAANHPYCRSLVFISGFYNPDWGKLPFNVPSLFIVSDGEKDKLRSGTVSSYLAATKNYTEPTNRFPIFRYLSKPEDRYPHLTTPARSIDEMTRFYSDLDYGLNFQSTHLEDAIRLYHDLAKNIQKG